MFFPRLLQVRTFVLLALALVLAVVSYGFAASNTVDISNAGDGQELVIGNQVTDVNYTVSTASNPATVTGISFRLAPTGGDAAADNVVVVAGGQTSTCTLAGGVYSCSLNVLITDITSLRVIAYQ